MYNIQQLAGLEGKLKYLSSKAVQCIPVKLHNSLTAARVLALKMGAPVVLTVNLSNKLGNGLDDYVKDMSHTCVSVYFCCCWRKLMMCHVLTFTGFVWSHVLISISTCSQIPSILSFGLAIHLCQGMILASVALHHEGAFAKLGMWGMCVGKIVFSQTQYLSRHY